MKLFLSKKISPPLLQHHYNLQVEQYRGLCALLVLLAHATTSKNFLIESFSWPKFVQYLGSGYLSVIVFFCISGYVISISHDYKLLAVKQYFKSRLLRLYPVYLVSIALCALVTTKPINSTFIGNLFFLQNSNTYGPYNIPVFINYATWSLNYEILYYALFIPLFFIKPKIWQLLLMMGLTSIFFINIKPSFHFAISYLNGYYFWISGLLFGWDIIKRAAIPVKSIPLLSMLFLQLCQHHLGIGVIILHTLGIFSNTNFNWIFDLPFCLMVMGILTGTNNFFLKLNKLYCYLVPAIVFIYLLFQHRILENERWIMCFIYWLLSLLLYTEEKFSKAILNKLSPVGKISYSLYLLHVPVAFLIKKYVYIDYRPTEIIVKYTLWLIITFGLSYLLEKFYQPFIKYYFGQKFKLG